MLWPGRLLLLLHVQPCSSSSSRWGFLFNFLLLLCLISVTRSSSAEELLLRSLRSSSPRERQEEEGQSSLTKPRQQTDKRSAANWETVRTITGDFVNITWPVKRAATVDGQIVLGGLMMVHEREEKSTCGRIMRQGGIQAMEVMLYTIDQVNQHFNMTDLLPGIQLGAYVLDDCDKDTYGLEMAVDFIKGSISTLDGEYKCPDGSTPVVPYKVIPGVVGAASSVTSIQVANLLRLFKIPQISFFSTSSELSNKDRFEYFSRTVPSDANQTRAMVDLVKLLNWTYISIVYEESAYGIQAFATLQMLLEESKICIAMREKLPKDSGKAGERHYDELVDRLKLKPQAKGVIVYGSDQEVAELMRSIRRRNATGMFTWIGSDGWSARTAVSENNELQVEGTLSFQPLSHPVADFETYFRSLTVANNQRNPWFVEYWEDMFQCKYFNSTLTPYNVKWEEECTGEETYDKSGPFALEMEGQLQFVSDAVLAFVHALRLMHRDKCAGLPGLCEEMNPNDGAELLRYLRKVKFVGLTGDEFEFDHLGDGPARYNVVHFKKTSIMPPRWEWVNVGQYNKSGLMLDWSQIRFNDRETGYSDRVPESECARPCGAGQAKSIMPDEKCCWTCMNCTQYQYLASEFECLDCPLGFLPHANKTGCYEIPATFLSADSYWAIGVITFACLGGCSTVLVVAVFIKNSETNVVKAAGRELSYVLLAGIFLCYAMTGVLLLKPCDIVCGVQMFGIGFCFALCYASLLTKTNRIARIFQAAKHTAQRPNFISPKSQLVICAGLVLVQMLIMILYMAYSPPISQFYYPSREENVLVCRSHLDASYMIAFTYPILLLIICTVYAVVTRKIPEAFNESQHIGFTMYTTCIIWLAFVPIFFSTATNIPLRITTLCASISLSGTVSLICIFAPKMYIILLRPERNVRQSLMAPKYLTNKTNTTSMNSQNSESSSHSNMPLKPATASRPELVVSLNNKPPSAVVMLKAETAEKEPSLKHMGSFSNVSHATVASDAISNDLSFSHDSLPSIDGESLDDVQL
ncbi:Metabotropic glutamate receptor 3 [Hypsibius exemplaris]|uniref:Metabotropic glutamate receptor 3 n=1 Tax=Hypsibius exemplaris TaxID=2072580 RepID=A0A1W0WJU0_HYPEX|nr:Metabotropic glutamate receptor 3 [Hypsibius exemplaris]